MSEKIPEFRGVYIPYPCDVIGHKYKTIICTYDMFVTQCQNCGQYGTYYQRPKMKRALRK